MRKITVEFGNRSKRGENARERREGKTNHRNRTEWFRVMLNGVLVGFVDLLLRDEGLDPALSLKEEKGYQLRGRKGEERKGLKANLHIVRIVV
jgi:hypothetical protein